MENDQPISMTFERTKLRYDIIFTNHAGEVGRLDFNGPEMVFTGKADESAKVFFDYIAQCFAERLKAGRDEAVERDAARYRWLRSEHAVSNGEPFIGRQSGGTFSRWTEEHADAAIDAALSDQKVEGNG